MNLKNTSPAHLVCTFIAMIFLLLSCSKDGPIRPDITNMVAVNVAEYIEQEFRVREGDILQSRLSSSDKRGVFWANGADAINMNSNYGIASAYIIWLDPPTYYAWKDRKDNGFKPQPFKPNKIRP